jgi:hypothetical protein
VPTLPTGGRRRQTLLLLTILRLPTVAMTLLARVTKLNAKSQEPNQRVLVVLREDGVEVAAETMPRAAAQVVRGELGERGGA